MALQPNIKRSITRNKRESPEVVSVVQKRISSFPNVWDHARKLSGIVVPPL